MTQPWSNWMTGSKVQDLMAELIDKYFEEHLNLPWDDAVKLHQEYYKNYGLAIEGLVRHHQIDPLEYNTKVDDALPLEGIIKPNPELRQLLEDIDRSKVKVWLLTNAYVTHGKRVVKLLGIDDQFEGLTFCDYAEMPLVCKPHPDMYRKAMKHAGVERVEDCYFVGMVVLFPPRLCRMSMKEIIRISNSRVQMIVLQTVPLQRSWAGRQRTWWKKMSHNQKSKHRSIRSATCENCDKSIPNFSRAPKECKVICLEGYTLGSRNRGGAESHNLLEEQMPLQLT